jgi:hypothetical protein
MKPQPNHTLSSPVRPGTGGRRDLLRDEQLQKSLQNLFHFCLGTKVEQKAKSETIRVLRNAILIARHRRYFSMFRCAALEKWLSQNSSRCVSDLAPRGNLCARILIKILILSLSLL